MRTNDQREGRPQNTIYLAPGPPPSKSRDLSVSHIILHRRPFGHVREKQAASAALSIMGLGDHGAKPMSEGNVSYLCEGFYPLEATDLTHAASFFALWKARRTYGPKGRCTRLDLQTELRPDGATFRAFIESPSGSQTCMLTILIDDNRYSQVSGG